MTDIVTRIYSAIEREAGNENWLTRLGASSIGQECLRRTYLSWRGFAFSKYDGRVLRLFQTGHLQEGRIVEDLRRAGFAVWDKDEDGNQFTYTDPSGHLVAKLDGVIKGIPGDENTPHTLEIKTHSRKSFDTLAKKGLTLAKPEHYIQIQVGLWLSGLPRGLYVALCKDDEAYYTESVEPNPEVWQTIQDKIDTLLSATLIPAGVGETPSSFPCKWCDMSAVCYREVEPARNCRTCLNSEPISDGGWLCALTSCELTKDEQLRACDAYSTRI